MYINRYTLILFLSMAFICTYCQTPNQLDDSGLIPETQVRLPSENEGQSVSDIDWHPNDAELVIDANRQVYLYSFDDSAFEAIKEEPGLPSTAFWVPDGSRVWGGSNIIWSWSPIDQTITSISGNALEYRFFTHTSLSPDSQRIAAVYVLPGPADNVVQLWDTQTHQLETLPLNQFDNPTALTWSPDGNYLGVALSTTPTIQIWDIRRQEVVYEIQSQLPNPSILSWIKDSDSNRLMAIADENGEIEVWDTESLKIVATSSENHETIYSLKWNKSGSYLASSGKDGILIWNPHTGHSFWVDRRLTCNIAGGQENRIASVIDNTLYVWNLSNLLEQ